MVLLAESLNTLNWAALRLTVSLCVRESKEVEKRERENSCFSWLSQTRSEGLCTVHLLGVNQQVAEKAWLSLQRILLDLWLQHNGQYSAEKLRNKTCQENQSFEFDRKMHQNTMSFTTG